MGDFLKNVFGGSDTEQQNTSGPKDVTPPEIAALRKTFSESLTSLLGGGGPNPLTNNPLFGSTSGTESVVAPITQLEQNIVGRIGEDALGDPSGREELLRQTIQGQFLPGGAQSNPFLQATIEAAQRPTAQAFEEVLGRALPGKFAAAGQQSKQNQGSSAFDRAAAIQSRGLADALRDIATNISFGSQEAERARQQGAATISQEEQQLGIEQLSAVALPRLIEQFGLTEGQKRFDVGVEAILKALQIATGTPLQTVGQGLRKNGYQGGMVMVSGKDDDHYIKRCASAGADGFNCSRPIRIT